MTPAPDKTHSQRRRPTSGPAGSASGEEVPLSNPDAVARQELDAHPATAEVAADLRLLLMRLVRLLRRQAGSDLSAPLTSALVSVEAHGPLTLGDLAARESVSPPAITRMAGVLAKEGLLLRRADPEDRRIVWVSVTPAGRRLLQRSRTRKTAYLARKLQRLSGEDLAALRAAMPVLRRLLEEDDR